MSATVEAAPEPVKVGGWVPGALWVRGGRGTQRLRLDRARRPRAEPAGPRIRPGPRGREGAPAYPQAPAVQVWPAAHCLPQVPQFCASLWVLVHTPSQVA